MFDFEEVVFCSIIFCALISGQSKTNPGMLTKSERVKQVKQKELLDPDDCCVVNFKLWLSNIEDDDTSERFYNLFV